MHWNICILKSWNLITDEFYDLRIQLHKALCGLEIQSIKEYCDHEILLHKVFCVNNIKLYLKAGRPEYVNQAMHNQPISMPIPDPGQRVVINVTRGFHQHGTW